MTNTERAAMQKERTVKTIQELTGEELLTLHKMNKNGFMSRFTNEAYYNEFKRRGLAW